MSTIWEMAAIIRAEEARGREPRPVATSLRAADMRVAVSVDAPGDVAYWCKFFGTTPMNLCCAIEQVGREPGALRRFLASRAQARHRR